MQLFIFKFSDIILLKITVILSRLRWSNLDEWGVELNYNRSNHDTSNKPHRHKEEILNEPYKYRSYYIEACHVKALDYEKAKTGKDLSVIVREALDKYFGSELKKYV